MQSVDKISKLLFDEKIIKILDATKEKPLNTKEISRLIKQPASNLYYPIKKLLEIGALQIVYKEQVKNMTENYYSSGHIYIGENISFEGELFTKHQDLLLQSYFLETRKVASAIQKDIILAEADEANRGVSELSYITKSLSYEKWKELNEELRKVIDKFEGVGSNTEDELHDYVYLVSSYDLTATKE